MKKKLAIIHDKLNLGGTEKALITMLKFFDYQKYDVTLWLMDGTGLLQKQVDSHVHIKYFTNEYYDGKKLLFDYVKSFQIRRLISAVRYRIKSKKAMDIFEDNLKYHIYSLPLITDEEYDCVIVYQGLYIQLLAAALGRIKAKKRIAWIHMRFNHSANQISSFKQEYEAFDKIYCVSDDLRNHFIYHYGMKEKVDTLYNLFDIEEIRRQANEAIKWDYGAKTVLCTVGRISPEKGQMLIPEIAQYFEVEGINYVWLIIGDGPQKDELNNRINALGLQNKIMLLGNIVNPYPYIKRCDIYIQPSLSEGFCTSTMEAKILGKPVVTTDVAGMKEQFTNGYDAFIVDSIDSKSIADTIKKLIQSEDLRGQFSSNTLNNLSMVCENTLSTLYKDLD